MLITSPFVIVAFVWQQRRMLEAHKAPLLPLPMFRDRGFASGQLVHVLSSIGKWAVLLGGLVQAAALTWVMWTVWTAGAALTGWDVTAPLTLVGAGMMTLIMPLTSITLESVPTPDAGAASGTLTTFGQIGMVLGVALAGSVFFGILQDTADARDAVMTALWVPIVAYVLAGLASVTMPDHTKALPQDA